MIRLLIADDEKLERDALTEMVARRFDEHQVVLETAENESKTDDAELAAAKDALDAAQKEVEKAQEAVDAATSIEERNALIEKLNEAVEKKKRKTKDPNFSPAWKSSDLFYKIPPGRHSSILPDKLHRLVDHQIFPGGLFLASFMLLGIKPKW